MVLASKVWLLVFGFVGYVTLAWALHTVWAAMGGFTVQPMEKCTQPSLVSATVTSACSVVLF